MTSLGEQFSDEEVDEILRDIDVITGNGVIRYEGNKILLIQMELIWIYFHRTCQIGDW